MSVGNQMRRAVSGLALIVTLLTGCGVAEQQQMTREGGTMPLSLCGDLRAAEVNRRQYGIPTPPDDQVALARCAADIGNNYTPVMASASVVTPPNPSAQDIQLERHGNSYMLPVRINDTISLPFILDTGAEELAIPADVALTLIRAGALSRDDFLGRSVYSLANGSEGVSERVIIREVQVGRYAVNNVTALVSPPTSEPLLGESFLSKFGTVTIDNNRLILTLTNPTSGGYVAPTSPASAAYAAPTNPASAPYGAIAWDKETGRSGWSWGQATAAKSKEVALIRCAASGCKVVMESGANQCLALATTQDRKHIGAASRTTQDAARLAAMTNCEKTESGECVVRFSMCNE
jgi:clan AA aspartic protease (TIGR02281 family)